MAKLTEEIALIQKEGAVNESIVDVNYNQARKIQREVENFYYDMITRRMSAEAAKEQAANMLQKIKNDFELGKGHLSVEQEKNLREWIYGGIDQITDIISVVEKLKNSKQVIKKMAKVFIVQREQMEAYAQDVINRYKLGEKNLNIEEQKLIKDIILGMLEIKSKA